MSVCNPDEDDQDETHDESAQDDSHEVVELDSGCRDAGFEALVLNVSICLSIQNKLQALFTLFGFVTLGVKMMGGRCNKIEQSDLEKDTFIVLMKGIIGSLKILRYRTSFLDYCAELTVCDNY